MKRTLLFLAMAVLFSLNVLADGVCIKDATEGIYFKLKTSEIEVEVNNQVAVLTTTQMFINNTGSETTVKYAFPLYEDASPTNLRWYVNGIWNTADFAPSPQDTTLPGGSSPDPDLMEYLGDTPLFFNIPDTVLQDSIIIVELTYVQLLPYNFNVVDFNYPNDYTNIQYDYLDYQVFHLTLESERTIENIELISHDNASITNTGNFAEVFYDEYEALANTDYFLEYQLNSEELGLFSFSTFLADSANTCDDLGNGFMAFVVEPDPNDSLDILQKVFTFIIDRSGSMSGNKIVQARNAASFIINNLNEGDYFNIVDFSYSANSFSEDHVPFNLSTQSQALNYIDGLEAQGSTNISGAFTTAISDFAGNDTTVANIIIFFTDGQATEGITSTEGILNHIQNQLNYNEVNYLMIHAFGIGEDVNQQLLSMIASQNNGLSEFLLESELEEMISVFYLRIRNPVLINTDMTFDPPLVFETFPNPIPNLYLGQQLIVVGRYAESDSITALFEGEALGQPQSYTYGLNLADSLIEDYSFLVKIWAKMKIDHLYIEYFNYPPDSPEAEEIKEYIIEISICYNVLSPFTHFTGGGIVSIEFDEESLGDEDQLATYNYPNPFDEITEIHLKVDQAFYGIATIKIYDLFGRLVQVLKVNINGSGDYSVIWNSTGFAGLIMPPGHYFYTISYGGNLVKSRMVKY